MSYKTILVHCDASRSVGGRLAVAAEVAQRFESRLVGLHAREPFEVVSYIDGGMALAPLMEAYEAGRDAAEKTAHAAYDKATKGRNFASEWRVTEAFSDDALAVNARYADLLVVGQADPEDAQAAATICRRRWPSRPGVRSWWCRRSARCRAVGKTVMLCWNASRESARAAADALPFLQRRREGDRAGRRSRGLCRRPRSGARCRRRAVARPPRRERHCAARRGGRCRGGRDHPVARRGLRSRPDRDGCLTVIRAFASSFWVARAARCWRA